MIVKKKTHKTKTNHTYLISFPVLYSSNICLYPLFFVSMTNYLLKKYDNVLHMVKNKNSKAGFLSGNFYFITGKSNMINAADAQLTMVAYGNTLG